MAVMASELQNTSQCLVYQKSLNFCFAGTVHSYLLQQIFLNGHKTYIEIGSTVDFNYIDLLYGYYNSALILPYSPEILTDPKFLHQNLSPDT